MSPLLTVEERDKDDLKGQETRKADEDRKISTINCESSDLAIEVESEIHRDKDFSLYVEALTLSAGLCLLAEIVTVYLNKCNILLSSLPILSLFSVFGASKPRNLRPK